MVDPLPASAPGLHFRPIRFRPIRSRPPLPSDSLPSGFSGAGLSFFLRLRHDSVRRFANLPNGDAGSLQSVRSACLSVRSVRRSVRPSARLSGRFARFGRFVFPSVWFVSPPVRPSAHSSCPRLFRPSARLSIRSAVPPALSLRLSALSDPCLSFYPFCPPICPPIRLVPSASSLRLSALSDSRLFLYPLRSSRPPALTFLSAPPAHLPVRASSLRSFVSVRSVRSVRSACPVRLLRPSRSGAAEFYSADFAQCFVFSSQDVFSHPISDTLLKSRRGELGISDNN